MTDNEQLNKLKEECRKTAKLVAGIQSGLHNKPNLEKSLSIILRAIKSLHEVGMIDGNKILDSAEKAPSAKKRNK